MRKIFYAIVLSCLMTGCGIISGPSRNEIHNDFYKQRVNGKSQRVYVDIEDQKISIYSVDETLGADLIDSSQVIRKYPEEVDGKIGDIPSLWEHNFDVDFLTIPLKYRPKQNGVPPQLNSELNGAAYIGYRVDRYKLSYKKDPLGTSDLHSNRFGFSFGIFTGIGNTAMTPTTTNNNIETEYDGVVWQKGLAAIVGINNFTIGFSLGFDSLLDENRQVWAYQEKPWIGLAVGLNLN